MADEVTTSKPAPTPAKAKAPAKVEEPDVVEPDTEKINDLVDQLKDALVEGGMAEDHADALLHGVRPDDPEEGVVGNLADLQRMGAAAAKGEDSSMEASIEAAPKPGPAPED